MKIVFATNNKNKLAEIRNILGKTFEIVSLDDIGCTADIPETGKTLEENAMQKARYVYEHYGLSVFADDTGLEVDALGGAPGIYSARYAGGGEDGKGHDSEANMAKLLRELGENNNRKARFRTVIALLMKSGEQDADATDGRNGGSAGQATGDGGMLFEGIVDGEIIREKRGGEGFGYDPIFQPEGYDRTFAELGLEIKNRISHRARAVSKLAGYLLNGKDL